MKPVPHYYWDFVGDAVEGESSNGRVVPRYQFVNGDDVSTNAVIARAEAMILDLVAGRATEKSLLANLAQK